MEDYLSAITGLKADVSLKRDIKRRIGRRILQEVKMSSERLDKLAADPEQLADYLDYLGI